MTRNLVEDEKQFNRFVETVLPKLAPDEVYFVSMSARNKYLTAEERKEFDLGRTEMFNRTLCRGDWNYAMRKLASVLDYKTTKNGLPYPEKALVVYVNINPSSSVKANVAYAKQVLSMTEEMMSAFVSGSTPNLEQMLKGDRMLLNMYQKCTGTRHYLDVDLDSKEPEYRDLLTDELNKAGVEHHLVSTRGGYHFLIKRESLNSSKFKLHEVVRRVHNELVGTGECVFNNNGMVPMPGTLQGGTLVELVY